MQAIIFALISYIGWGTGDVFATIAARRLGAYSATFWYLVTELVIFVSLAPFFLKHLQDFTLPLLLFASLLGVIGLIGLITFYEGVRIANASLVGTISASFSAITVVLSILFFGESVTSIQVSAILIIILGLVISTLNTKDLKQKKLIPKKGVLLAGISMITWGVYWAFIKIPVQQLGWFWPYIISILSSILIFPLFLRFRKIKIVKPAKNTIVPIVLNALLLGIGAFSFNYAISKGLTSVVAPIAGSYPTLFALLAYLAFKDAIVKREIVGIATTLSGIVLLSIFSV